MIELLLRRTPLIGLVCLPLLTGCTWHRVKVNEGFRNLDVSWIEPGKTTWKEVLERLGPSMSLLQPQELFSVQLDERTLRYSAYDSKISGLDPRVVQRFSPFLSNAGFELAGFSAAGSQDGEISGNIEPGMPVMLELIGGDLTLGGS